jgi:photosystem II stability/assembly factor-like uncharacterized protein
MSCATIRFKKEEKEKEARPSEWFYLQRTYPEKTFNTNNYLSALSQAQSKQYERGATSTGFDVNWESQGPNNIGGRMNSIAVHPTNNQIILLGSASGGLFRTIDGGTNWNPVFDAQNTLSIGDITFAPSNPNIVFAGTGDPNISGYPFVGTGIYKSTDGGVTWAYSGLSETRIVSKIIVHPTNPEIVYAATMGSPFERNEHRGLYKSTDGGANWTKIFYASSQAGIIDMVMPTQNPSIIYIAAWDRIRTNTESITSGPATKVYRSFDAGGTWLPISGLPQTDNGRIGLAISPTSPSTLSAIIANTDGDLKGIYRTTNTGATWTNVAINVVSQNIYNGMGWYFGKTVVSSTGDIYALGIDLWRYKNNTWENITEMAYDVHVDMHDLIVNGNELYLATDGGAYKSDNNGTTWRDIENIATTQCYRVSISPHAKNKYWVGAQDNGTVVGNKSGINQWNIIQRGDGFKAEFLASVKRTFFVEQQQGNIWMTRDSGATFENATLGIQLADRRGWDMPYFASDFIGQKFYTGTERVYRSNFSTQLNWQPISLDLTKGNLFGEQFHFISCLAESKQEEGVVYAGTSDGNLWSYEQNSWFKISNTLPDRYVTSIRTSPSNKNTIYVTHSGYKDNDNTPLIHRSLDKGSTWQPIKGNLPDLALNDICILPKHQDSILFVATDGGVYASKNKGQEWQRLGKNMPYVPVYELELDTLNRLLVAATHGRGVMTYPIDSITYRPPVTQNISGKVTLPNNTVLKNISILVEYGAQKETVSVDANGTFTLNNRIPTGTKVKITPSRKDNKATNGVTAADLVAIQKHVLTVLPLNDPLKLIAADANASGNISAADLVLLRKLVLTVLDTLPKSWRFVPKNYIFPNPQNPFSAPNFIEIPKLDAIRNDLDFIGIKTGDVNNSASGN